MLLKDNINLDFKKYLLDKSTLYSYETFSLFLGILPNFMFIVVQIDTPAFFWLVFLWGTFFNVSSPPSCAIIFKVCFFFFLKEFLYFYYFFIYLFIFGCVGSLFLCKGFL